MQTRELNLILLDVQLIGDVSGYDLLNIITQEPSLEDLQVVRMDFNELSENKFFLVKTGANDYLIKPIQVFKLESILIRYLSKNDFYNDQMLI